MFQHLNDIANGSTSGAEWMSELSTSKFDFTFELDNEGKSRFEPDNEPEIFTNEKGRNEATIEGPGGGTVYINEANPTLIKTEKGEQSDLTMTIAHELLGHGIDSNRGTMDINTEQGHTLNKTEFSSSERENVVRAELNKPLRTHYGATAVIRKTRNGIQAIPSEKIIRASRRYKKN